VSAPSNRLLSSLSRRLRLLIARAVVTAIDDSGRIQAAQVRLLDGEVRDEVEILHQYGFTSIPPGKREGLYFSVGGDRDHGVMVCVADREFRLGNLEPGETAIHTDEDMAAGQHRVHFKRGQEIHLIAGDSSMVMTPSGITLTIGASRIALTAGAITITTPSLDINKG
jgi:phage baseplate assembly protein V